MRKYFTFSEFNRLIINDMLIYLIPLLGITVWNYSNSLIVLLTSTYSIGFIIFSRFSGYLIDRYNSRIIPIYVYSFNILVNVVFASLIISNVDNFLPIFIFILLLSLASSILEINTSVFIPDYFANNLTSINSVVQLIRSIVNFISPIIAFALSGNMIIAFTILIGLQVLNLAIYLIKFKNIKRKFKTTKEQNEINKKINSFKYIFKNNKLLSIVIVTMAINFSMTILTNTIVIYLVRYLKIDSKISGVIIGMLSIGAILGALIPKMILKRYSFEKSIGLINLLLSIPFLLVVFNSYFFFVGVFIGYLCRSFGSILRTTVQYKTIPENIRGKINSTIYLFTWGMIPIAGYSASLLLEFISLHTLYIIISVIFVLANSLFLFSYKKNEITDKDKKVLFD